MGWKERLDVQGVYQSMLKEHEVSTNAVLRGWDYREKQEERVPVLWEYGSVEFAKGPCRNW